VDTQVLDAVLYYAAGPRERKTGWQGLAKEVRLRSLQAVAQDFLGERLNKDEQTSDFGQKELTAAQVRYSLQDAKILIPLKEEMMRRVRELGLERVSELEARLLPALANCENYGFTLDIEGWCEQATRAAEEAEEAVAECAALAPPVPEGASRVGWNWGSTKQVGEALGLLGARPPKTEKGNPKTDDAALKGIAPPANAARLARAVLRHREAKKRVSTWGLGWFDPPRKKGKKFDKGHQFIVNGRTFTSFRQVLEYLSAAGSKWDQRHGDHRQPEYHPGQAPPGRLLECAHRNPQGT
jgi:DNA polymerase I-like protein with 3'-5' exonuclease and polymerase domains